MVVAGAALLLASCKDDDTTGFSLYGFNPNPGTRGEAVTFYGEGLDAVTSVVFQGGAEVSEITRNGSSISVIIPMTAQPGYIELKFAGGSYMTRSELTIDEPLESGAALLTYTDFANKTNGVTTVGGKIYVVTEKQTDYLSDIVRAEFEGEEAAVEYDADAIAEAGGEDAATDEELVALSEKVAFVRGAHLVIVTVPEGAKSGTVSLYNSSDDRFEAPEVQIAQSEAQSITPSENVIPGTTRLTVTGENFGLVTSVRFTGDVEVASGEIDANEDPLLVIAGDGKSLTVMTKIGMQDGPLALQTKSGDVIATPEVTTVVPAKVSSWTEGDLYKAGKNMTLSCSDTGDAQTDYLILSQIGKVYFYKADGSQIETAFEASDEHKCLNITIPAEAVDGKVGIATHAGKEAVAVGNLVLVKATVTGCDTEVAGGEAFTVTGTDLDLVASVKLGNTECTFTPGDGNTTLKVATERTYTGGKVTLTQANGLELTAAENLEILAVGDITVTSMPAQATQGDEITVEGQNFNMIESVYLGTTKVTSYTFRSDTQLSFIIPTDVPSGSYALTFNLTKGTTETSAQIITVAKTQLVEKAIWEGTQELPSGWSGSLQIQASAFEGCTAETLFTLYLTTGGSGQLQFKSAADGWPELQSPHNSPYWNGVDLTAGDTNYAFKFSAEDLAAVQQYGMVVGGQNATLTRLTKMVTEVVGDRTTVELWSGRHDTETNAWGVQLVEASKFAPLPADATYTVAFESPGATDAQLTFKDPTDWSALLSATPSDPEWGCYTIQSGETAYSFNLDAGDLAKVQARGMYLSGQKVVITKLSATYNGGGGSSGTSTKIWEGSFDIGNWSAGLELGSTLFQDVKAGDKMRIAYETYTIGSDTWYQLLISAMSDGWPTLSDFTQLDVAAESTSAEFTVTEAQAAEMKAYGIALKGHTLIIKSVEIIR